MHEIIELISSDIETRKGTVSAEYWNTDLVKLISKKDGSYTLGVDVRYTDEKGILHHETQEVKLDENNVPFIEVGSTSRSFDESNTSASIESRPILPAGVYHIVEGPSLFTIDDGMLVAERSVFAFDKKCLDNSNIRKYFSGFYRTAGFNNNGLAIMLKLVQNPEMKRVLDERVKPIPEDLMTEKEAQIRTMTEMFFAGKLSEYELKSIIEFYSELKDPTSLNPNTVISLDLREYEHLLSQGQPTNN